MIFITNLKIIIEMAALRLFTRTILQLKLETKGNKLILNRKYLSYVSKEYGNQFKIKKIILLNIY